MPDLMTPTLEETKEEKQNTISLPRLGTAKPEQKEEQAVSQDTISLPNIGSKTPEQNTRLEEAISFVGGIATAKDPDAEAKRVGAAWYLSDLYGRPFTEVYDNIDTYNSAAEQMGNPKKSLFEQASDGFTGSFKNTILGGYYWQRMFTRDPEQKRILDAKINKMKAEMPSPEGGSTGFLATSLESGAGFAGSMIIPAAVTTLVGMFAPPVLAPLLSGFGAQAPKIVKGVATLLAGTTGFYQSAKMEGGLLYGALIDTDVPEEVARQNAIEHGLLAGALEMVEVGTFLKTFPVFGEVGKNALNLVLGRKLIQQGCVKAIGELGAKYGMDIGLNVVTNTLQERWQKESEMYFTKKANLDDLKDFEPEIRERIGAEYDEWFANYTRLLEEKGIYYESDQYAQDYAREVWNETVNAFKGSWVLALGGGGVQMAYDTVTSAISSRENMRKSVEAENRLKELAKEKEELKAKPETEATKKREEAINAEEAEIAREQKQNTVDEAMAQAEEAKNKYYENPTPENKQRLDEARETQGAVERETEIPDRVRDKVNEREDIIGKAELSEDDVEMLGEYDQDQEVRRYEEGQRYYDPKNDKTENFEQDWQKSPEEIETPASEPMAEGDVARFAKIIREKTPEKVSDIESEVIAAGMLDPLARSMKTTREAALNAVFMPEIAMNVEEGKTYNIDGQQVYIEPAEKGYVRKGAVYFSPKDGKAIILLTKNADASTWVHEVGHIIRRHIAGDMKTELEGYYNVKDGQWTRGAEEQFTEDLTTFIMTGRAPTTGLKKVFQIIKDALLNIYHTLDSRDMLSEEKKEFFRRLFSENQGYDAQNEYNADSMLYSTAEEADAQYKEIEAQYKGTDQWLKAPNGQPTKLTERQWVQVRTPAFIRWFGDWLNDPDNASKVLDPETKEPMVVYHSTTLNGSRRFFNFKTDKPAWFTPYKGYSEAFIDKGSGKKSATYAVYLNIKNSIDVGDIDGSVNDVSIKRLADYTGIPTETLQEILNESGGVNIFNITNSESFKELLQEKGFDGIIAREGGGLTSYAVFSPEQIKSATDNVGTFSQSNPSILFQTDTEYLDAVNSGDMAKAQAMVDQRAREQGYTIKAYHGSPETDITEFDKERIGEHTTAYGDKAFWFSDSQKFADDFAYEWEENKYTSFLVNKGKRGRLYSVDLKINKPFDLRNITPEMRDILFEGTQYYDNREAYDKNLDNLIKARNHQIIKLDIDYNLLQEKGYDAVIANLYTLANEEKGKENADAIEYGVFSPNQIKSADPVTYDDAGNVIPLSQRFNDSHSNLLFQSAYHGSGASFDKFDTDFMGTGEGAQAFGWGIYLTQSHGIAEGYADKLADKKKVNYYIDGKKVDKATKEAINYATEHSLLYSGTNIHNIKKAIEAELKYLPIEINSRNDAIKTLEDISADIDNNKDKDPKDFIEDNYGTSHFAPLLRNLWHDLQWDIKSHENRWATVNDFKRGLDAEIKYRKENTAERQKLFDIYNAIDLNKLEVKGSRNLYTVSIPDDNGSNYLKWDKNLNDSQLNTIIENLKKDPTADKKLLDLFEDAMKKGKKSWVKWRDGENVYGHIEEILGSPKAASEFLASLGYVGIDYPANSMSGGNKYGKRNFVIFNADDITIDDHLLWQETEQTYEEATEQGNYVPDDILEQYRGQEWADAEISAREDYRADASDYMAEGKDYEQFAEAMRVDDPQQRTDDYYKEIWNSTEQTPKYENAFKKVSKRMLEKMLHTLNKVQDKNGLNPEGIIAEAMKLYRENGQLSDEQFDRIMAEINASPDKAVEYLKDSFAEEDDFNRIMKALERNAEDDAISEINKYIKSNKHYKSTTMRKLAEDIKTLKETIRDFQRNFVSKDVLKEKIAELKKAYKERALFNKLVRSIFRKPSGKCAIEEANEIRAIQDGLAKSTMLDRTRARLEFELRTSTNDKVKSKIQKLLNKKSVRDMSLDELADIAEHIKKLNEQGVQKRVAYDLSIREQRLDTKEGLLDDIGDVEDLDKSGSVEGRDNKGNIYNRFVSFWCDIHRMTEMMGKHWVEWVRNIRHAHEDELRNVDRRMTAIKDKMKELKLTPKQMSKTERIADPRAPKGYKTYTHDTIMCYYAYMQNADSEAALVFGNFKGDPNDTVRMDEIYKHIDDAIATLTKEEKELVDFIIDSFSGEDKQRLFDVARTVDNISPEPVLRYFPMKRVLDSLAEVQDEPLIDLNQRTAAGRASVRKGYLKERLHDINWQHQKPLQLSFLSTTERAIQDQEHYIAFAQLSKDMKYVYGQVIDAVASKYGKSWADGIRDWVDRCVNPNSYNAFYGMQTAFDKVISNSVVASLAYNALSWLKQFPSVMFYLPYTDAGNLMNSFYRYVTNHKEMTEFAMSRSQELKNRNIDDAITMTKKRLQDPNSKFRVLTEITDWGMKPYGWFDEFACVIGWNAVYTSEMSKGATEQEAIDKANEALLKTQPQADAMFSPRAYSNPKLRIFLLFTRQANQITQMMFADFKNMLMSDKEKMEKVKFMYRLVFCVAMNALLMGWAGRKFKPYGDDDESPVEDALKDIVSNAAYNLPVVGSAVSNTLQRKAYTSGGYSDPISQMVTAVGNFAQQPVKNGDINYDRAMRMITETMGTAGLPKVLLQRAYRSLKDEDLWTLFIGAPLGGRK